MCVRSEIQQVNIGILWSQSGFIFLRFEYSVSALLIFLNLALYICIMIDVKTGAVNLSVGVQDWELNHCCDVLHPGDMVIILYYS